MEPYNNLESVSVDERSDRLEKIIILTKDNLDSNKKYYFPVSAFTIKKWSPPHDKYYVRFLSFFI